MAKAFFVLFDFFLLYNKQIYHCFVVNIINTFAAVPGQLYRLCWALRNSTEERIDLDAEEKREEEADVLDAGNAWCTSGFCIETLCS